MRLANAAKYFDRLEVRDAYSGRKLFRAQFDLFDDSERDAIGMLRRTLSVAPGTQMPARLAITAPEGYHWIVGATDNMDTFGNEVIRDKYTLHRSSGLARVCTPAEVIAGAGGTEMHGGLAWIKDWREEAVSSRPYPYCEIYFAAGEPVEPDRYVVLGGRVFRIRSVYTSEAGFKVAEADDLQAALQPITYSGTLVYDPITDEETATPVAMTALVYRFSSHYQYDQASAEKMEPGDLNCVITKADVALAEVGRIVVYSGVTYRVISVEGEQDCWRLHIRP